MLRIHDHFLLTPSALYMRVSGCSTQVSCLQLNYDWYGFQRFLFISTQDI